MKQSNHIDAVADRSSPHVSGVSATSAFFLLKCALLVALVLVCFPPGPPIVGVGLDFSWVWGLNIAHARDLLFGSDIVFTFGPLGYVMYPAFPEASSGAVAFTWLALYAIWAWALFRIVTAFEHRTHGVTAATMAAATGCLLSLVPVNRLEMTCGAVAIAAFARAGRNAWIDNSVLAILTGCALLMKLNAGLLAGSLLVITLIWDVVLCRRSRSTVPWPTSIAILLLVPLTSVAVYWVCSASIASFPAYIRMSFEIMSGYPDAMALPGPLWQTGLGVLSVAALFIAIPLLAARRVTLLPALLPAAIFVFFEWKQAMTRQDAHAAFFQVKLAFAALFVLICARCALDRRLLSLFWLFSLIMGLFVLSSDIPHYLPGLVSHVVATPSRAWSYCHFKAKSEEAATINQQALATRILPPRIKQIIGNNTTDVFPNSIDIIRANDLVWSPRPTMQSYAAYTPRLDDVNAAHLRSGRAPANVLLSWEDIDSRNPFSSDPLSWRELLNRYQLVARSGSMLLLQRSDNTRLALPVLAGSGSIGWNQQVPVPPAANGEVVMVRATIRKTFRGRLKTLVTRATPVTMHAEHVSGRRTAGRVVVANLVSGVVVSDWPANVDELSPLFSRPFQPTPDRVKSITFMTANTAEYEPVIQLSWWRVAVRDHALRNVAPKALNLPLVSLWDASSPLPHAVNATISKTTTSIRMRSTSGDPQLTFQIGPELSRYQTLVIRAKYEVADQVNVFFGREVEGRGYSGRVPVASKWLDLRVQLTNNPYWGVESGTTIRFDPVSDGGVGSLVDISNIWGSESELSPLDPDFVFTPVESPSAERKTGAVSRVRKVR